MNNKKITKKINFLLKEEVTPGWNSPSIPQIGAPGGPITPYPTDGTWNPDWWSEDDVVHTLPGLHPWSDIPELMPLIPNVDPFLSPFGNHNPTDDSPRNSDSDDDYIENENEDGWIDTPGYPPPNRIPENLIPNIPMQPAPGWENYFQSPPGSGQWWYAPYGSPNNPNSVPSGL